MKLCFQWATAVAAACMVFLAQDHVHCSASTDGTGIVHAANEVPVDVSGTNVNGFHLNNAHTRDSGFLAPFSTDPPSEAIFKRESGLAKLAPIINMPQDVQRTRAIPTNKWWGNLIHISKDYEAKKIAAPVWSNPYGLKLPIAETPFGLQVCYSFPYRKKSAQEGDSIRFYLHEFVNDLTLSASEFSKTEPPSYEVVDWTDLGVHVRICGPGSKCMKSSLVNGMAFVSATYNGLTPWIASKYKIAKLEEATNGKYVIQLEKAQTWVLYTGGSGTTFTIDESGKAIVGSGPSIGTIRVAVLPEGASTDVYDAYAGCVVHGGMVSVESRTSYSFNWQVNGTSCDEHGYLHFAFPHHLESLANSQASKITLQSTVRGPMVGQVSTKANGFKWTLQEPEMKENIDFYPPRKPSSADVQAHKIKELLEKDIDAEWDAKEGEYYVNGKLAQKYASLCLMADDSAVVGDDKSLLKKCTDKLQTWMAQFLKEGFGNTYPLVYDTTYRGIITSQAIVKNDPHVDFGNGVYNDHHYHYGYWVSAAAMLRKLNPTWEKMPQLETVIWTLLRDVANPSRDDVHFPTFRHFSWFLGHSYSHGVTPFNDGKDQESTSEDINFCYGMMLWGKVTGKKNVEDLGSLMLRIDAHAVRTYFLMDADNKIHPPEFVKNRVTGIFFDNKAEYATWFGREKVYIHGIQMIPVSPITEIFRTPKFIKDEWDDVLSKDPTVASPDNLGHRDAEWLSLIYVNYATINPQKALPILQTVKLDNGLSRSWALYIASTKSASVTPISYSPSSPDTPSTPTVVPSDAPQPAPQEVSVGATARY